MRNNARRDGRYDWWPGNDVRRIAADEDVDIANINAPNQIVISGELANVETAVGVAKEYGIGRAMMLKCRRVSFTSHGKWLCEIGESACDVPMQAPRFPVISNVTGEESKKRLRKSGDSPRSSDRNRAWTDCMQRLIHLGCDFFIELGPATCLQVY